MAAISWTAINAVVSLASKAYSAFGNWNKKRPKQWEIISKHWFNQNQRINIPTHYLTLDYCFIHNKKFSASVRICTSDNENFWKDFTMTGFVDGDKLHCHVFQERQGEKEEVALVILRKDREFLRWELKTALCDQFPVTAMLIRCLPTII